MQGAVAPVGKMCSEMAQMSKFGGLLQVVSEARWRPQDVLKTWGFVHHRPWGLCPYHRNRGDPWQDGGDWGLHGRAGHSTMDKENIEVGGLPILDEVFCTHPGVHHMRMTNMDQYYTNNDRLPVYRCLWMSVATLLHPVALRLAFYMVTWMAWPCMAGDELNFHDGQAPMCIASKLPGLHHPNHFQRVALNCYLASNLLC